MSNISFEITVCFPCLLSFHFKFDYPRSQNGSNGSSVSVSSMVTVFVFVFVIVVVVFVATLLVRRDYGRERAERLEDEEGGAGEEEENRVNERIEMNSF